MVPAIRAVLRDEALAAHHDDALRSLARAGGAAVAPELTRAVAGELAFWKEVGSGLPKGWWNGSQGAVKWEEVERLRYRYGRAYAALNGLKEVRPPECRQVVTELRDYWRSLPQLAEVDQLAEGCDEVIAALPKAVSPPR